MIHYNYNWIFDNQSNNEYGRLRIRVRWNKNVASISLGTIIERSKWSQETQRCLRNAVHTDKMIPSATINREMERYEHIIESIFDICDEQHIIPTKEYLLDQFQIRIGKKKAVTEDLLKYFNQFMSEEGTMKNWADNTYKAIITIGKQLKAFYETLPNERITEDELNRLVNSWIKTGYRNTYIDKSLKNIRWFLNWLHKKGLYTGDLHKTYHPKLKKVDDTTRTVVYLTWDELLKLYNFPLKGTKAQVRDVFCFCCFTSLRYSDAKHLQRCDVKQDTIEIVTEKTHDALSIDLNNYSRAILDRYKNKHFPRDMALPVLSLQEMNRSLKEIAKQMKLNEPIKKVYFVGNKRVEEIRPKHELITTHCGRRTFIVNALYLGIPAEVIIKWTGHTDYKAMKPYIAIVDDLRKKEMSKFNIGIEKSMD